MGVLLVGKAGPPDFEIRGGGGVAVLKDCIITYNSYEAHTSIVHQWDVIRKSDFSHIKRIPYSNLTPNLPQTYQALIGITGDPYSNRFFYVGNNGYVCTAVYAMAENTISGHTQLWLLSEVVGPFDATKPLDYPFLIGALGDTLYVLNIVTDSKIFSLYKRKIGETAWTIVFENATLALTDVVRLGREGGGMGVTGSTIILAPKCYPYIAKNIYVVSISNTPSIVAALKNSTANPSNCGVDDSGYLYANSWFLEGLHKFRMDSSPNYFQANRPPIAPSNLSPAGPSSSPTKVTTLTPTISWRFTDPDPADTQSAYQVIIKEGTRVVKNSGKVQSGTYSYEVPANTLQSNTTYHYTVKIWDQANAESSDSVDQYFKTTQAPTATPTSPTGTSGSPARANVTPRLNWTYTDYEGHAQEAFLVKIYNAATAAMVNYPTIYSSARTFYDVPAGMLTAGTKYYWTVQVVDSTSMWSAVTAPQYFITNQAPSAPNDLDPTGTSASPTPVPTLTPTITWRFTDPDGDRQSAYQIIIREGAVEVDNSGKVTNSTSSYTVPVNKLRSNTIYNYTVRVWDQTDEVSQDSVVQYFKTRQAPNAPVDLNPAGPSTNPVKVPTLTPTITWRFTDPDGDRQSAYQIIIREGAVEVDNSGKVTNSTSSYTVPVNKLRSNTIYNYTVKVWDQTDEASQDSVVQYFKTRQAPTAEPKYPLGPSANPVRVPTLTPTINWRYIDPEGLAQEKFQVKIYNAEDDHIVYDTGEILSDSDDFDYVVPAGKLTAGKTYYWTIQVWNINTNSDVTEPQYFKTS